MAATAVSVAAAVTGVAVVQSGIPGTGALPIVRHAGVPAVPEGPGLPAPGEAVVAPPSAGAVQEAPATVVRARTRPGGRPEAREQPSGKEKRSGSDEKSKSDSGSEGKDTAGKDDSGGKDSSGKGKSGKDG
jgi:hypothetical protein